MRTEIWKDSLALSLSIFILKYAQVYMEATVLWLSIFRSKDVIKTKLELAFVFALSTRQRKL